MLADLMQQITDSIMDIDQLNQNELSDDPKGYPVKKCRAVKGQKQLEKKKSMKKAKKSTFF
jgi:hypothetical protein